MTDKQIRPPYEIALMHDHILRLEEETKQLKAENEHLAEKEEEARHYIQEAEKFKNCISEIKSLCYEQDLNEDFFACEVLQKINECEVIDEQ